MFEFAPIAMAITTSDAATSSYVKVNDAYLKLTGRKWSDIRGKKLTTEGAAIDSPARDRRHRLLADEGAYVLEEVDIVHANGTEIPTLISAQRTVVNGVSFDVEVILDVSARVKLQREMDLALRKAAMTDALSGLPNRACFEEFMAHSISHAQTSNKQLRLAFIDLNGFKIINDTMGHAVGDEILKVVSQRLREKCRSTDFVARIGGDEFVALLETDPIGVNEHIELLKRIMERVFEPIGLDGRTINIGAAIGVALLDPSRDTPATLLKKADERMYFAKASGDRLRMEIAG
ncbi:sensor domain-containing diguanylate cyclase [Rhizobium tubonense]|uniref:Sensor domain-containing diguanylate cyclase n=2 Tax=Rhizobium tubonense TaxID=484088 RepID=A0A2W4EGV5_9HYPH|nr:sensor domain-containing diguanylate cyclase [Rhizobium tubonense]